MKDRAAAWSRLGPALLFLVIAWFLYEGRHPQPQVDDAFISYRYARNLADGFGLIYNLGERVEGFSNLLWTLLVALGVAVGGEAARVGYYLGLISGAAALIAAYLYASTGVERSRVWIAAAAPFLLMVWIGFPIWTLSGLETPLFAAAIGAALAAEARGHIGLAIGCALVASLTRPEGPLLAGVILAANFAGLGSAFGAESAARRRVIAWGVAYALSLTALTVLRVFYYGAIVPNTFFAKVGEGAWLAGAADFGAFAFGSALPLFIPATWAALRDPLCRVGATWAVAMSAYIVWVGGDAFPDHRFWVPIHLVICVLATRALIAQRAESGRRALLFGGLILASVAWSLISPRSGLLVLSVLAAAALASVWGGGVRRATAAAVLVVALVASTVLMAPWLDDSDHARWSYAMARLTGRSVPPAEASRGGRAVHLLLKGGGGSSRRERLGTALWARADHLRRAADSARRVHERRAQGEAIDLVAATAIGKFGYDVRIAVLDMLGLTDAHIARSPVRKTSKPVWWLAGHARTDADYVFGRRPDYIFLPRRSSTPLRLPLYDDVWGHPALDRDYEWDDTMKAYRSKLLGPRPSSSSGP